jgi:hypothetical protein
VFELGVSSFEVGFLSLGLGGVDLREPRTRNTKLETGKDTGAIGIDRTTEVRVACPGGSEAW